MRATIFLIFIVSFIGAGRRCCEGSEIKEEDLKKKDVVGAYNLPNMLSVGFNISLTDTSNVRTYALVKEDKKSPFPGLDILARYTPEHKDYKKYLKFVAPEYKTGSKKTLKIGDTVGVRLPKIFKTGMDVYTYPDEEITYDIVKMEYLRFHLYQFMNIGHS
ncbi:uncharacterized protein LOC126845742 isoform X2 [Adelges cooleyi]|uniref:uncharacterized protein LOC126845742 isoform X2 n=1 Tax=Adelges cooleyi TaxID=133065 RepID=UPI00217F40C7|nr:uncharacterized protein LOC126845742 isoform X2 [Adelges cooleyi]